MVDAEEWEREENFSLESKVRRTESLIPDSLSGRGAAWMKNLSSAFTHARLLRPRLPRTAVLSRFSVSRYSEERRSFAEPLPIKFDGRASDLAETYFAVESSD